MGVKFRDPIHGHIEEISIGACLAAFFLGPVYLLANGFRSHAVIWLCMALLPGVVGGSEWLIFSVPATCAIYGVLIHLLIENKYRSLGWRQVPDDTPRGPGAA
ncbi:hypothetical protein PTE30175_04907 [Pandoraea terrae]|uniref:Uncharacterized protein n=1 Tax=Pandoraea terrae TaxID=1537710 RepID=A0A5E4Z2K8_9BURK|nr:hypothetical protein [Pandoraea terrae]VVE55461.1 hypothetical protein PTE30175_04907 [Pandoraea terrae]